MNEEIPKLRTDIEVIPANYQGKSGIIVKDPLGLIKEPIFLHGNILEFMGLINGKREKRDIQLAIIRLKGGILIGMEEVERILKDLDTMFLLDSERYRQAREEIIKGYSLLQVRCAALAGHSYPEDRAELERYLHTFLSQEKPSAQELKNKNIYALVAPHIELQSGSAVYSAAYGAVRHLAPKRIILMGTGHNIAEGFVSVTEKIFETPLGTVNTNRDLIRKLKKKGKGVISAHDMAHRSEHSLEIQLLFLQYLFGSEFALVPLLFGSFQNVLHQASRPSEIPGMMNFLEGLKQYLSENMKDTLIAAGVDLSHIGPKFGHHQAALTMRPEAKRHDQAVIEAVCRGDVKSLWEVVSGSNDRFNVCGFSTLACLLEILPDCAGTLLGYDTYNEEQTNSAVSFAAVVMTAKK